MFRVSEFDDPEIAGRLLRDTGHSLLQTKHLPPHLASLIFDEPFWLLQGRVDQLWRSAEHHGSDLGPKICAAVTADGRVNAAALPHATRPVISMTAGACVRIRQLMRLAVHVIAAFPMTRPEDPVDMELFSRFLDPSRPQLLLKPIDCGPGKTEDEYFDALALPIAPTVQRVDLANNLTLAAFDFMAIHEISHIIRRHDRRLVGTRALFMEATPHNDRTGSDSTMRRQLLELDADLAAAPLSASKFGGLGEVIPAWRKWTHDPVEVFSLWLTALGLTFSLFDCWSKRSDSKIDTHPPASVRLIAIASAVYDEMDKGNLGLTEGDILQLAAESLQRASQVWEVIDLPPECGRLVVGQREANERFQFYNKKLTEYGIRFPREGETGGDGEDDEDDEQPGSENPRN